MARKGSRSISSCCRRRTIGPKRRARSSTTPRFRQKPGREPLHRRMRLDVVIPTYNRSELLQKTLRSLLDARVPPGLDVQITVVDNNSSDDTRETVVAHQAQATLPIHYVFDKRQGGSPALNAGVATTSGTHVGFIDDDEEIDPSWYEQIYSVFNEHDLDFIGGPCVARFESA